MVCESQSLAWRATAALESLNYGIAILNVHLRIAFANGFARRALADCCESMIRRAFLAPRSGDVEHKLAAKLRRASRDAAPASMMRLTRNDGRGMFLWCVRLPPSSPLAEQEQPGILIVLRDPHSREFVALEDLQALYGLTFAKAQIALGRGQRLDAVAANRRVKLSTVRTQLPSVLAKMGLPRQADLARTLASLAKPVTDGTVPPP